MNQSSDRTPEQARKFLGKLGLLNQRRIITGDEREKVLTMLRLTPSQNSNNQRIWTETWVVGNITYHHHVGDGFDELEEVTNEPSHS